MWTWQKVQLMWNGRYKLFRFDFTQKYEKSNLFGYILDGSLLTGVMTGITFLLEIYFNLC